MLWVDLPAKDKMAAPGYQTILDGDIPNIALKDDAGSLRLIAGEFEGHTGPSRTFTPIDVWDLRLNAGKLLSLDLHEGRNTALVLLKGSVQINGAQTAGVGQLVLFEREGRQLTLEASEDAVVLLLSGVVIWRAYFSHLFGIEVIRLSALAHALAAFVLILSIIVHIYAGIWIKGSIGAMLHGWVSRAWARKHHELWYREVTGDKTPGNHGRKEG